MEIVQYPLITALTWLLCEALKSTLLDTRWLPVIAAGTGALLGAGLFLLTGGASLAEAILGGISGGLAATGVHEAVSPFLSKK